MQWRLRTHKSLLQGLGAALAIAWSPPPFKLAYSAEDGGTPWCAGVQLDCVNGVELRFHTPALGVTETGGAHGAYAVERGRNPSDAYWINVRSRSIQGNVGIRPLPTLVA